MKILTSRNDVEGCYMPVAWGAEDALARLSGFQIAPIRDQTPGAGSVSTLNRFRPVLGRLSRLSRDKDAFIFAMGLDKSTRFLLQDSSIRKWLYIFDTWEPQWERLANELRAAKQLKGVYLSSSQTALYLQERLDCPVAWVPQAARLDEFSLDSLGWSNKSNIVLNIGRVNQTLDSFFLRFSEKHDFEYIRERIPGQVCFASRSDFLDAIRKAKIVVVHPRDMEYPDVTGCVSMLTARYFESYQSSSVVCGYKPRSGEFETVMQGFPFIEHADDSQFERELIEALSAPYVWGGARERCLESHTWDRRLELILHDLPS